MEVVLGGVFDGVWFSSPHPLLHNISKALLSPDLKTFKGVTQHWDCGLVYDEHIFTDQKQGVNKINSFSHDLCFI